jgi:hypothetical protein
MRTFHQKVLELLIIATFLNVTVAVRTGDIAAARLGLFFQSILAACVEFMAQ